MNKYKKFVNDELVIKDKNLITIIKDGMQIFNPTEEMLLNDGWELYKIVPKDLTELEIFNIAKENLIQEIIEYDSSENVNIFFVNNYPIWLDKATRVGLMLRLQAEDMSGIKTTTLWYNGDKFELPVSKALHMLHEVELYASKCYDITQVNLYNVNKMSSVEELESYNYKEYYPEKCYF